jgi:ATP-dependent Clp protease ATP-binding subunit ClpA
MADSSRRVLRLAVRECTQMKQAGIGTMHLLIGLCGAGAEAGVLNSAFLEKGIDSRKVAESAREMAVKLVGGSGQGLGISANATMVIRLAVMRAQMAGSMSVTADDLLAGILDWGEGTALQVLEEHGLTYSDLAPRVPQFRIGALSRETCVSEVWRLLMKALLHAGGRPLDTPTLFRAMLRAPGGASESAFRRLGIDADAVRQWLG